MPGRELNFGVAPCVCYMGCVKGGVAMSVGLGCCGWGPLDVVAAHLSDDGTVAKMGHPVQWEDGVSAWWWVEIV